MASVPNSGSSAPPPPPVWDTQPIETQLRYAGFWARTGAALIDAIILGIAYKILSFFLVAPVTAPTDFKNMDAVLHYLNSAMPMQQIILYTVIVWGYFALQESSAAQATIGKRALGLRVSTCAGTRLDFAKASLRAWPMFLPNTAWLLGSGMASLASLVALVACLTVAFSSRKQGVHDMMADALVVKR